MTIEIDEAIERYTSNAEYERTHGNLQGCLEFSQLAEWLKELKMYREMIPSASEVFLAEIRKEKACREKKQSEY